MRVSIPTHIGTLTERSADGGRALQATPGLGLTLDPSHYICGPHKDAGYDQVYPYVFHVHLRDWTADQLQVRIGLGEVDYSRLISQLNRHRYNRALSVDLHYGAVTEDDQRPIELRKMHLLLESLL